MGERRHECPQQPRGRGFLPLRVMGSEGFHRSRGWETPVPGTEYFPLSAEWALCSAGVRISPLYPSGISAVLYGSIGPDGSASPCPGDRGLHCSAELSIGRSINILMEHFHPLLFDKVKG